MPKAGLARIAGRAKLASGEVSVRVRSSTLRTVTLPKIEAAAPRSPLTRSSVKTTSSLVTRVPSEKVRSLCSRSVSHLPSGDIVYSARPARGFVWSVAS